MQMVTVQWFVKCGLTAAVLLLACGFATARFGHGLQLPSITTRDGSLITLNRYAKEPIPDVVLVGSSLAFRLKEEYFATTKLRNLVACWWLARYRTRNRGESTTPSQNRSSGNQCLVPGDR